MRKFLPTVLVLVCVAVCIVIAVSLMRHGTRVPVVTASAPRATAPMVTTNQSQHAANPAPAPQSAPAGKPAVHTPTPTTAATVPDWANLPEAIRLICGQGDEKRYPARVAAVHQLGANLSAAEIQALVWLLHQKCASQGDLSQEALAAIKNDVLEILISQGQVPPDLGKEIVGMYRDRSSDFLWRDYCVQHFAMYYDRMWPDASEAGQAQVADDANRKEIVAAFGEALQERDNGIEGVALLGLYGLSGKCPEASKVGDQALAMAMDGTCAAQTRVTAVAVCGLTGKTAILPEARILAQTAEVLPLRLASIATIGSLGNAQDRELLQGLRAGPDERTYKALDAALKKLERKVAAP